jgi:hypothetical protein
MACYPRTSYSYPTSCAKQQAYFDLYSLQSPIRVSVMPFHGVHNSPPGIEVHLGKRTLDDEEDPLIFFRVQSRKQVAQK